MSDDDMHILKGGNAFEGRKHGDREDEYRRRLALAEVKAEVLQRALTAAHAKLAEYGWVPFGTHVNNGGRVLFSAQVDEQDGMPYFERWVEE